MKQIAGTYTRDAAPNVATVLAGLFEAARNERGFIEHRAPGNIDPHAFTPKMPAVAHTLRLSDMLQHRAATPSERHSPAIQTQQPGEHVTLSTTLLKASRVAQAGAHIIPISAAPAPVDAGTGVAWYDQPASLSVITHAPFATLADGATLTPATFPALRASVTVGDAPTAAVRFKIERANLKAEKEDVTAWEVMTALMLGIAREADRVLLAAIAAVPPTPFALAAAAAKGLMFGDLRALAGTAAAGAAVGTDGVLRVVGIAAELTDVTAGTYVGAFTRSAVAVHDDIRLLIERRDVTGKLAITAFVNMEAVLPDPAAFWNVA